MVSLRAFLTAAAAIAAAAAEDEDHSGINKETCYTWPFVELGTTSMAIMPSLEYNQNIGPTEGVEVYVAVQITEIDSLDDVEKTLRMAAQFTIQWTDSRLVPPVENCSAVVENYCASVPATAGGEKMNNETTKGPSQRFLVDNMVDSIWIPPLKLKNLWGISTPDLITDEDAVVHWKCTGTFVIVGNYNMELKCDLQFASYPFDKQYCVLSLDVINRANQGVKLRWKNNLRVRKEEGIASVLNKVSKGVGKDDASEAESTGNWQMRIYQILPLTGEDEPLEILFTMKRYVTSHIIQTFLPSAMLVLASLASLWVPTGLVPGRMALAVTTTLTLQSMINSVFTEAPRTSYLKALDVWLVTCFVFTFLVLVEYCAVLSLSRTQDWYDDHKRVKQESSRGKGKKGEAEEKKAKWTPPKSFRQRHIAYLIEKWSRVLLPFAFVLFSAFFVAYYVADFSGEEYTPRLIREEYGYDLKEISFSN